MRVQGFEGRVLARGIFRYSGSIRGEAVIAAAKAVLKKLAGKRSFWQQRWRMHRRRGWEVLEVTSLARTSAGSLITRGKNPAFKSLADMFLCVIPCLSSCNVPLITCCSMLGTFAAGVSSIQPAASTLLVLRDVFQSTQEHEY